MTRKSEPKKIDVEKLDRVTILLRKIANLTSKFNTEWKALTPQEKAVAGGITFHIVSPWNDFSVMGVMVDRALGAKMINVLVNFFNRPPQERDKTFESKVPSIVVPDDKGNGDDFSN